MKVHSLTTLPFTFKSSLHNISNRLEKIPFQVSLYFILDKQFQELGVKELKELDTFLTLWQGKPISLVQHSKEMTENDPKSREYFINYLEQKKGIPKQENDITIVHLRCTHEFRIHGFFLGDVFYILKLDPFHRINK